MTLTVLEKPFVPVSPLALANLSPEVAQFSLRIDEQLRAWGARGGYGNTSRKHLIEDLRAMIDLLSVATGSDRDRIAAEIAGIVLLVTDRNLELQYLMRSPEAQNKEVHG